MHANLSGEMQSRADQLIHLEQALEVCKFEAQKKT